MTTLPMWEASHMPHEGGDVWVIAGCLRAVVPDREIRDEPRQRVPPPPGSSPFALMEPEPLEALHARVWRRHVAPLLWLAMPVHDDPWPVDVPPDRLP
jgi:hypothetical protein